jgi:hypothetical protein
MLMIHKWRDFSAVIALILVAAAGWAQSAGGSNRPFGLILYAQGNDVSIYRDGRLTDYDLATTDVIGLPVFTGDLVQTGPGTFVELQLQPSTTQLKIAENTTFRIQSMGSQGTGQIDLTYGRIRAKVEHFAAAVSSGGSFPFSIRGQGVVAGVRGTDFGYDYVAGTGGATIPLTRVYCFQGTVEVSGVSRQQPTTVQTQTPEAQSAPETITGSVLLNADEMVSISAAPTREENGKPSGAASSAQTEDEPVIQTDSVSPAVTQFWKRYDFASSPISTDAAEQKFPKLNQELEQHFARTVAASGPASEAGVTPAASPAAEPSPAPLPNENNPKPNPKLLPTQRISISPAYSMGVAIGGLTIGLAGLGLSYFGTDIFPGMSSFTNGQLSNGLMISGGILFAGGLIAYLFSQAPNAPSK